MKHVLIAGLGSIGRRHLKNIAQHLSEARITVLRHKMHQDADCTRLGARITDDLDDVLSDPPDLAIVATPSVNHIDILPSLISSGCHLLVEKPIVSEIDDCDALLSRLEKAPPAIRVSGFNFRFLPSLQKMRDQIGAGHLGNVVRAHFSAGYWLPNWRPDQDYRQGYSANAARGGGVELDLVHEIDVARWIFGPLQLHHALGRKLSALDIHSHDTSVMTFTAQDCGTFIQIALDYVSRQRLRRYEIVGDEAGLLWSIDGILQRQSAEGAHEIGLPPDAFNVDATYKSMLAHMIQSIDKGEAQGLQSLADGIESTRLAIEARDWGKDR